MNKVLKEGLRLRAIRARAPVAFRQSRRIPLLPEAILWTAVSKPGDPSVPLGIMLGTRTETPNIYLCDNPYSTHAKICFYKQISEDLKRRLASHPPFMQIIVGSLSDAQHLLSMTLAAGRIGPKVPKDEMSRHDISEARRLGLYLVHPVVRRGEEEGQAALITLTEELAEHIATPLADNERANLGVHLAWIEENKSREEREKRATFALAQMVNHQAMDDKDERIYKGLETLKTYGQNIDLHKTVTDMLIDLRKLHEEAYDTLAMLPEDTELANYFIEKEKKEFLYFQERDLEKAQIKEEKYWNERGNILNHIRFETGIQKTNRATSDFLRKERQFEEYEHSMLKLDRVARAGGFLEGSVTRGRVVGKTTYGKFDAIEVVTQEGLGEFDEHDSILILDIAARKKNGTLCEAEAHIEKIQFLEDRTLYMISLVNECEIDIGMTIEMIERSFRNTNQKEIDDLRFKRNEDGTTVPYWTHSKETPLPIVGTYTSRPGRVAELFAKW